MTTLSPAWLAMYASSSGVQADVEHVRTAPMRRHGVVRLEVLMMIPAERRDAIAAPPRRATRRAPISFRDRREHLAVRRAVQRAVGAPRDDRLAADAGAPLGARSPER